jgi:hypothetical protein
VKIFAKEQKQRLHLVKGAIKGLPHEPSWQHQLEIPHQPEELLDLHRYLNLPNNSLK